MDVMSVFRMPTQLKITSRTSTMTHTFVSAIMPVVTPCEDEIVTALTLLGMDPKSVACTYCGDTYTEWDHLRPLIINKMPTGYITEIRNLVPSCGKCNQSKGNKEWRVWIFGPAKLSPKTRGVKDIAQKARRLEAFEAWGNVTPMDFQALADATLWNNHWEFREELIDVLRRAQINAGQLKESMATSLEKHD